MMEVQIVHRSAFHVAGLEIETLGLANGEKPSEGEINQLWGKLHDHIGEIQYRVHSDTTYGLMTFPENWRDGIPFRYLAGVEVSTALSIPSGMVHKQVPASDYAVVTYRGPLDGIGQIWRFFYQDWLPNSSYHQDGNLVQYEFERYDSNWETDTPGECEMTVWFPVSWRS